MSLLQQTSRSTLYLTILVLFISASSCTKLGSRRLNSGLLQQALQGASDSGPAPTHFVDPSSTSCSDTGDGSLQTPWCSFNAGLIYAKPGNVVGVVPGTYHLAEGPGVVTQGDSHILPSIRGGTSDQNRIYFRALSSAERIIGKGSSSEDPNHQVYLTKAEIRIQHDFITFDGFYFKDDSKLWVLGTSNDLVEGFVLKNSMYYIEPRSDTETQGARSAQFSYVKNFTFDHNEFWTINFDPQWASLCEDTNAGLLLVENSEDITIKNSYLFGAANGHNLNSGKNFVIEKNHSAWHQEHHGGPGKAGLVDGFIYRHNVFGRGGQEGPFISATCRDGRNTKTKNGLIENNLSVGVSGLHFGTWRHETCEGDYYIGIENIINRNNLVVVADQNDVCYRNFSGDVNVLESDYNWCIAQVRGESDHNTFWYISQDGQRYTIQEWQNQSHPDHQQIVQDPHSQKLIGFDPGYVTPLANLLELEGIDYECSETFAHICTGSVKSNCKWPYRVNFKSDYHLKSNSPLIGAGMNGATIGPEL